MIRPFLSAMARACGVALSAPRSEVLCVPKKKSIDGILRDLLHLEPCVEQGWSSGTSKIENSEAGNTFRN